MSPRRTGSRSQFILDTPAPSGYVFPVAQRWWEALPQQPSPSRTVSRANKGN